MKIVGVDKKVRDNRHHIKNGYFPLFLFHLFTKSENESTFQSAHAQEQDPIG